MVRISHMLVGLSLLLPGMCLSAQSPSNIAIEPFLNSDDPRMNAFGAWAAARRDDDAAITRLLRMVEQWQPPDRDHARDGDDDRRDAMLEILDTLIQRKTVVPALGVAAIASSFPDQALILVDRLPRTESEPLLLSWYQSGRDRERVRTDPNRTAILLLARVAAMILARNESHSFAPMLLADAEEHLAVSVTNPGEPGLERCLVDCRAPAACQAESADEARTGWPPLFQYAVKEDQEALDGSLATWEGDDRVAFLRVKAEMHLAGCDSPAPLDATKRRHLLARLLGIPDEKMPWSVQMDLTLPWINDGLYLRDLSKAVNAEETGLRATAKALYARGLLTQSELRAIRPRLAIVVFDDRGPSDTPHPALPPLPSTDDRTTYRVVVPRH
jgi:hypothetical protein